MRIAELEEMVKSMNEENQKLQDTTNKAVKKEERAKGKHSAALLNFSNDLRFGFIENCSICGCKYKRGFYIAIKLYKCHIGCKNP